MKQTNNDVVVANKDSEVEIITSNESSSLEPNDDSVDALNAKNNVRKAVEQSEEFEEVDDDSDNRKVENNIEVEQNTESSDSDSSSGQSSSSEEDSSEGEDGFKNTEDVNCKKVVSIFDISSSEEEDFSKL